MVVALIEMKPYLESLDPEQLAAAIAPTTPLAVMAGAGSGKTMLVVSRLANQIEEGVDPKHMFVSAFTRAAANEMRDRVEHLVDTPDLDVNTFHSLMFRFFNGFHEASGRQPYGVMKEGRKKILFQKLLGKPGRDFPQAVNLDADPGNVIGQIGRWKNATIAEDSDEIKETLTEAPSVSDMYAAAMVYPLYEQALRDEHLIDFDDMLFKSLQLLSIDADACSQARSKWSQGVFLDECQDMNLAQWRLVNAIAPPAESPNLTVVGDLRQCLYSFRGASPEIFEQFVEQYKDAQVINLISNYRSSETIVGVSNALASGLGMADQKSKRGKGSEVEVSHFSTPVEQSIKIAEDVAEAREDGELGGNFAVLVRTNAQSAPIESAFVARGLPYWCNGGGFFDRMEVGDLMSYLRIANDFTRTDLLERIINRPTRYLGKAFVNSVVENLPKHDGDLIRAVRLTSKYSGRKLSPKQREGAVELSDLLVQLKESDVNLSPLMAINRVLAETDYIKWLRKNSGLAEDADSQRLDNIEALKLEAEKFISIKDFLDFADESSRLQIDSKESTRILTVHKAKGLEWDTVWVTNMHDDSIPHAMSKREGDIVSEKRVAYVAFTRAENHLKVGVPKTDEKGREVQPSRFLRDAGLEVLVD